MDTYTRIISSFSSRYSEEVKEAQLWAERDARAIQPRVVRVVLAHWRDEHVDNVVSRRLVELSIRDNGPTVDVSRILRAVDLEVLILNGSDVRNALRLPGFRKLKHLGLDATFADDFDFDALVASLASLEVLELDGGLLVDSPPDMLAAMLLRVPRLREVVFRAPPHLLGRTESRGRFDRAAEALRKKVPNVKVGLAPRDEDHGTEVNP